MQTKCKSVKEWIKQIIVATYPEWSKMHCRLLVHQALKLMNRLINIYQAITQQKAGLTLSMSSFSILSPLSSLSRDLILELISRRKRHYSQLQLQILLCTKYLENCYFCQLATLGGFWNQNFEFNFGIYSFIDMISL